MFRFKMTRELFHDIREDLLRPHPFAKERVGFVFAGLIVHGQHCTSLAHSFMSIEDDEYIDDPNVCARFGPKAMHKAMSISFENNFSAFHVHLHAGCDIPRFSEIDIKESINFIPNFINVCPQKPHGTIVFNQVHAFGNIWLNSQSKPRRIDEFLLVGSQCRKWRISN